MTAPGEGPVAPQVCRIARRAGVLAAAAQLEDVVSIISFTSDELKARIAQSDHISAASAQRLQEAVVPMNQMNASVRNVADEVRKLAEQSTALGKLVADMKHM